MFDSQLPVAGLETEDGNQRRFHGHFVFRQHKHPAAMEKGFDSDGVERLILAGDQEV